MASSATPSLDGLPAETRAQIFRDVLRSEHSLTLGLVTSRSCWLNVSILTLTKAMYKEALEALYDANTFRLCTHLTLSCMLPISDFRAFVRRIELFITAEEIGFGQNCEGVFVAIDKCSTLPRLKQITVSFDSIAACGWPMRYILQKWRPREILRCLDIGVFELTRSCGPKVYFEHFTLKAAWPVMKAVDIATETFNVLNKARLPISRPLQIPYIADARSKRAYHLFDDLKSWLAGYEMMREAIAEGIELWRDFDHPKYGEVPSLFDLQFAANTADERFGRRLPKDFKLKDIDPSVHDAETLEWATGILGANVSHMRERSGGVLF